MNKLTLSAAFAGGLMLLASCQSGNKFSLTGSNLPEEANGTYIYLVLDEEPKDSVRVENGAFAFSLSDLDETHLWRLYSEEAQVSVPVIKEAGSFTLATEENGKYIIDTTKVPEGLNAAYAKLNEDLETETEPIVTEYQAKYKEMVKEDTPEEQKAALQSEIEALQQKFQDTANEVARSYYEANKDNAVGVAAFSQIAFEEDSDFIKAYEEASDAVKSNDRLKSQYDTLKVAMETSEGSSYKGDYPIEDGEGNTHTLAEFKEEGKYLLVDFWASWCGPCRRAMPHIAGIAKDHSKTITVLSVGVWDKEKANNDKAREELGMTWNVIYDKESKSADEYGITGIPTLLLIDPEGTIVYRGHDPEAVDAKIQELGL